MNLKEAVAQKVSSAGPIIAERVVTIMAEATIAKRVKMIADAYAELDNLAKELRKEKPDVVTYTHEGEIASAAYSKAKLDARNKIAARISKVENAINKALENNDFNDLGSLGAGNKGADAADDTERS